MVAFQQFVYLGKHRGKVKDSLGNKNEEISKLRVRHLIMKKKVLDEEKDKENRHSRPTKQRGENSENKGIHVLGKVFSQIRKSGKEATDRLGEFFIGYSPVKYEEYLCNKKDKVKCIFLEPYRSDTRVSFENV